MNERRIETKVGFFVLLGLILLAALLVMLSKGNSLFTRTYELRLSSENVGGVKKGANVLLSGVSVGRVTGVYLSESGKTVTILLSIRAKYDIYNDAQFDIEQFGFLGDQYVAITPGSNTGRKLRDGDEVHCSIPFNMQEAVARAAETISKIGQAATNLNQAVADVRRELLTEETLHNLASSLAHFGAVSFQALEAVSNVNYLVGSNVQPITVAVSNLNYFSVELAPLASQVNQLVSNNIAGVNRTVENIQTASTTLTNLMQELQTGDGVVGRLVRDEVMAANLSALAHNLAVTSSNLNRRGLWGILWSHKPPESGDKQ